ncbi:MAG: biotin/lipoyl-containing protein, partial [Micromonosporaceae bacterium]
MSRIKQFKLPDLGEGLTEGEILSWLVKPGDEVKLNQPIVEVETAKAAVEIPSPYAGVVTELFHGEGDTVEVGSPIIAYDTDPGAGPAEAPPAAPPEPAPPGNGAASSATSAVAAEAEEGAVEAGLIGGPAPGGRTAVLVGYGPRQVAAKRRARKSDATPAGPTGGGTASAAAPAPAPAPMATTAAPAATPAPPQAAAPADIVVLAKPPVRKLAKELGVDLRTVTPTGPNGSISRDDVLTLVEKAEAAPRRAATTAPAFDASREQRIPIKGVRKLTAENMVASAFTAPHVTEFLTIDATRTVRAVSRLKKMPGWDGVRVSPLLLAAKAILLGVRRHPMVNSTWDAERGEIVVKEYVNLGIAAATP